MTFEEWWMTLLPTEVDELKLVFESCWIEAWTGGAKEEREACAKLCDNRADTYKNPPIDGNEFIAGYFQEEAELCAFAIRKLSNAQ